jgi:hypothetical protein
MLDDRLLGFDHTQLADLAGEEHMRTTLGNHSNNMRFVAICLRVRPVQYSSRTEATREISHLRFHSLAGDAPGLRRLYWPQRFSGPWFLACGKFSVSFYVTV